MACFRHRERGGGPFRIRPLEGSGPHRGGEIQVSPAYMPSFYTRTRAVSLTSLLVFQGGRIRWVFWRHVPLILIPFLLNKIITRHVYPAYGTSQILQGHCNGSRPIREQNERGVGPSDLLIRVMFTCSDWIHVAFPCFYTQIKRAARLRRHWICKLEKNDGVPRRSPVSAVSQLPDPHYLRIIQFYLLSPSVMEMSG